MFVSFTRQCKQGTLLWFISFQDVVSRLESIPPVVDIEDLTSIHGGCACPFYLAKELQVVAEVVFMPYNYIIDPFIRQTLTFDLSKYDFLNLTNERSIVIFDEAHNLESICSDASSFELSTKQVSEAIKEIQSLIDNTSISKDGDPGAEFTTDDLVKLKCNT